MRRLIIGCDGTWNKADQQHDGVPCPTNVVRLAYRVSKTDGDVPQMIYYDQGVGTGNGLDALTGGAFGSGLEENVHDAYRFLVANYQRGDEIYLFGFSRGAFTARSIAGMIRKCGILSRTSVNKYHEAIALYRDPSKPTDPEPVRFRLAHSVTGGDDIPIKFIGVWDTVGALGIPVRGLRALTARRHEFFDTELSGTVEFAYHALAIDERRAPFEPTLWMNRPKPEQTVEQVWFVGVHSDVGGGYPQWGLSDIALGWMLEKAAAAGLALEPTAGVAHQLAPSARGILHDSMKGLYALTPGSRRTIGLEAVHPEQRDRVTPGPDPTQSLHPTVLERWDSDATYRPRNLREYLVRIGDARGAAT